MLRHDDDLLGPLGTSRGLLVDLLRSLRGSIWGPFGVYFRLMWDPFGVHVGSIWIPEGSLGIPGDT